MNNEQRFNCINVPNVTVLMSVYNGEKYLREAIESILNQTFQDFEFLIIDDGSTDTSRKIILSYTDPKIRLICNEQNIGLTKSLNLGIDLAKGEYIARMDADDISLPQRLEIQVEYMDAHPDVGICGSDVQISGEKSDIWKYPTQSNDIKSMLIFNNSLAHPSVIMRKKILMQLDIRYNDEFRYSQDYELWARFLPLVEFSNIDKTLIQYRQHTNKIGSKFVDSQKSFANSIRLSLLKKLKIVPTTDEFELHYRISIGEFSTKPESILSVNQWLLKINSANNIEKVFPSQEFSKLLAQKWYECCTISTKNGIWIWNQFWNSPLAKHIKLRNMQKIKFLKACILKRGADRE